MESIIMFINPVVHINFSVFRYIILACNVLCTSIKCRILDHGTREPCFCVSSFKILFMQTAGVFYANISINNSDRLGELLFIQQMR